MVKGPEFTAYRNRTQSPSSVACRIPCMPYALGKFCADIHVDSAFGWQTQNCFRPLLPISLLMPSQQAIQWPLFAFNAFGARAQHTQHTIENVVRRTWSCRYEFLTKADSSLCFVVVAFLFSFLVLWLVAGISTQNGSMMCRTMLPTHLDAIPKMSVAVAIYFRLDKICVHCCWRCCCCCCCR